MPMSDEHKRKISEGLKRYHKSCLANKKNKNLRDKIDKQQKQLKQIRALNKLK
tara:strand:+ start:531 stop:689 length:159 start_codon:yes stop_codon:yes gene_type:complete